MNYTIGTVYLFVNLKTFVKIDSVFNSENKKTFELSTPSTQVTDFTGLFDDMYYIHTGIPGKRYVDKIKFIELTCKEIKESRCAHGSSSIYKGYIFEDPKGDIYTIQYPHASYGQLSDRGDFIASRSEEYIVSLKEKGVELAIESEVFDQYELFSNMIENVYDSIAQVQENPIFEVKYHDDKTGNSIMVVNNYERLTRFFVFLLRSIPSNWTTKILKENLYKTTKNTYLVDRFVMEKIE